MGLLKLLLKAILIPIVIIIVIVVVIILLIKMRRDRKKKERELEKSFQPPPVQQWVPYTPVQQPAPAYVKTPGVMEQGIGHGQA
ncbi:African swine fever virus j13L [Penicillium roqueforti FM164]|uniref:African swine fever virus j13L n=1 Tax=Penicillium roqueforti (strain FM164) TaxID=1365484 RepID=W6Q410_PENRF|nr:African swine fever virus j13L [Penicillium roqueforti FM164]